MILAGDIGGTNTRLSFFDGTVSRPHPLEIEVYPSGAHQGAAEIVRKFLSKHPHPVEAACFGVAGPVRNGRSQTPNLPWIVDAAELARDLKIPSVQLANDLEVNAHGIAVLGPEDFETLNEGAAGATGNRALISAGTGLGEAGLLQEADGYRPWACEGGHVDFAPRDETEIALLEHLLRRFDHVSYERVLSGPGLHNIYLFLRDTDRGEEPASLREEMLRGDPSAVIAEHGLKGSPKLCAQALNLFASIYGAEAGNLALKTMALGGVFVGGGIAPKILPVLREPNFMSAFVSKGRISTVLKDIPVRVILNDKTALLGAGRLAMRG